MAKAIINKGQISIEESTLGIHTRLMIYEEFSQRLNISSDEKHIHITAENSDEYYDLFDVIHRITYFEKLELQ